MQPNLRGSIKAAACSGGPRLFVFIGLKRTRQSLSGKHKHYRSIGKRLRVLQGVFGRRLGGI